MELRSFTYGMMAGIAILVVCFVSVASIVGVKFQPVFAERHSR